MGILEFIIILALVIGLSSVSGWNKLAKAYLAKEPFPGQLKHRSARIEIQGEQFHRSKSLLIGESPDGIYMAPWPLLIFRWTAPPVFIPWEDISLKDPRPFKYEVVELSFPKVPGITIGFREWQGKPAD